MPADIRTVDLSGHQQADLRAAVEDTAADPQQVACSDALLTEWGRHPGTASRLVHLRDVVLA
jgi:hypothetical protein